MFKTKLSVKGKFWRTFCRIEAGFSFLQSKLIRNFDGVKEKQDFHLKLCKIRYVLSFTFHFAEKTQTSNSTLIEDDKVT